MKVKSRVFYFNTNWNEYNELVCACLVSKKMCNCKECEELELTLKPFEDIEEVARKARKYKRVNGRMRQIE